MIDFNTGEERQMSEIRKEYLKKAIAMRYDEILLTSLKRISRKEKENIQNQKL